MNRISKSLATAAIVLASVSGAAAAVPATAGAAPSPQPSPNQFEPAARVTFGKGMYIYLTPNEQKSIAAGALASIAQGICGAAPEACIISWGAATAAGTFIGLHGICGGEMELFYKYPIPIIGGEPGPVPDNIKCV